MTQKPFIVGLYSPAPQSGKSTVAGVMEDQHGYEKRSFATALKRMVVELLYSAGLTPEEVGHYMSAGKEEPIAAVGGVSFRYLCQTLGTEWGRTHVASNLWVDLLLDNPELGPLVVVDDVRFPNEAQAIVDRGGKVFRVTRSGVSYSTEHASEGALEHWTFDGEITNDGDLTDLEGMVDTAVRNIASSNYPTP